MGAIPFYGTEMPDLFRIERESMDRAGKVIGRLDALMPKSGPILDVGAGDGFTAERLQTPQRLVVDVRPGIQELRRVVEAGGPMVVVENLGDDELSSYAQAETSADRGFWAGQGFACEEVETLFEFADQNEADALLSLYSGRKVKGAPKSLS